MEHLLLYQLICSIKFIYDNKKKGIYKVYTFLCDSVGAITPTDYQLVIRECVTQWNK